MTWPAGLNDELVWIKAIIIFALVRASSRSYNPALAGSLIAPGRDKLSEQVSKIISAKILAVFPDIDVPIGERVFVFTVDRGIQNGSR